MSPAPAVIGHTSGAEKSVKKLDAAAGFTNSLVSRDFADPSGEGVPGASPRTTGWGVLVGE
jgi:hypothetical protein